MHGNDFNLDCDFDNLSEEEKEYIWSIMFPNMSDEEIEEYCTDISKNYKYIDGKETNESDGHTYTVVCPVLKLERLTVKVESDTPLIDIEKDGEVILVGAPVKFTNLITSVYISKGQVGISAKADSISFVKQEQNNVQIQKENKQ